METKQINSPSLEGIKRIREVHSFGMCDRTLFLKISIITKTRSAYSLEQANAALRSLRNISAKGSAVIIVKGSMPT